MFDFNKLGDMAKIAGEAKNLQAKQDKYQDESLKILKKISSQLDEMVSLLKKK